MMAGAWPESSIGVGREGSQAIECIDFPRLLAVNVEVAWRRACRGPTMITLALDTTTAGGGAALIRDRTVIAVEDGDGSRPHGVRLPGDVIRLLDRQGLSVEGIDAFGVAVGPGGFTGLRVGLATVQGLALVHRRPVVPVGSLEAMCRFALATCPIRTGEVVGVWMDAHRGEVFSILCRVADSTDRNSSRWHGAARCALDVVDAATVGTPERVAARWRECLPDGALWTAGEGAIRYATALSDLDARPVRGTSNLAPMVGLMAEAAVEAGAVGTAHRLTPVYIRRPDVELARSRSGG